MPLNKPKTYPEPIYKWAGIAKATRRKIVVESRTIDQNLSNFFQKRSVDVAAKESRKLINLSIRDNNSITPIDDRNFPTWQKLALFPPTHTIWIYQSAEDVKTDIFYITLSLKGFRYKPGTIASYIVNFIGRMIKKLGFHYYLIKTEESSLFYLDCILAVTRSFLPQDIEVLKDGGY